MFKRVSIYLMLVAVIFLNILNVVPVTSRNVEQPDQRRSLSAFFGRYGIDPNYLLTNRPYYDDDVDKGMMFYKKRQLKKKWAKFSQGSQSPYTIAFPALIRTRRWINQEQ